MKREDLAGQRFGKYVAISPEPKYYWKCRCDCGVVRNVTAQHLKSGKATRCRKCHVHEDKFIHGMRHSKTHRAWSSMKGRCLNPNIESYKHYGARGIRVCERWHDFMNFLADMGVAPKGSSLDRLDSDKDYAPGNCRWATTKEQNRNQRRTVRVKWKGETRVLSELAEEYGLTNDTVYQRHVRYKWPLERALGV